MQLHLSTRDGVPIYLQIVQQVKYLLASGRLAPGEQLPPVRKLAEQLLVNPNTVARAYRELEAAGVLQTRRGSGVFASDAPSPLARREQKKILTERVDLLLSEASQMGFALNEIIELLQDRSRRLNSKQEDAQP